MLTYVFLLCVCIALYALYISPFIGTYRKLSSDGQLNNYVSIVQTCSSFDERSYTKAIIHLKRFLFNYSNTFSHNNENVKKLKRNKYKTMHYLRRIPYRLHNDADLEYNLKNAIDAINLLLENYIADACDRNKMYYFPTTS